MYIQKVRRWLEKPARLVLLNNWLRKNSPVILDVGCGNHSPGKTKRYFPDCRYYGADRSKTYNLSEDDFALMENFYEADLSDISSLTGIPDNFFDCIILSHVIEHLSDAETSILSLLGKLKKSGIIYIETPSPRSLLLPSMPGTLNFKDDPSHIRLYPLPELEKILKTAGCDIIRSGTVRLLRRIFLLPLYLYASFVQFGHMTGGIFWDITGFANFVIARKNS